MAWARIATSIAGLMLPACSARVEPSRPGKAPRRVVASNIAWGDYAGSKACEPCHQTIYDAWRASPMANMTRRIAGARVRAPFDGRVFRFMGDRARLHTAHGQRFLTLDSKYVGHKRYRITRVIGGTHREDFAGVEVAGTGPGHRVVGDPRDERVLPVSWVFSDQALRYKGYSVMTPERPGLKPGSRWIETCVFCHNTVPYLATVYDDLHGPGAPSYQGRVSDHLLPPDRRFGLAVTDAAGLRRALAAEVARLRGRPLARPAWGVRRWLRAAARSTRRHLRERHLVEVGIGCESCHGGSREHTLNPRLRPTFELQSSYLRAVPPARSRPPRRADWINRTCVRCHTVLFSAYPATWEGGHRWRNPGGSNINSGEARNFLLGACSGSMSCTSCHDPHRKDDPRRLRRFDLPSGNGTCLDCHGGLRSRPALEAHTRHKGDGPGSACLACHMPRKNMGLEYTLTRYHRIASPTDKVKVERDRPLECALCHTGASVESLVDTMERWWGKRYDRGALRRLYGPSLGVNAIDATLDRGRPHEQAVAIVAMGERGRASDLPRLIAQLAHKYPLLRYYARDALQRVSRRSLRHLDMSLPGRRLRAMARGYLLGGTATKAGTPPARRSTRQPAPRPGVAR